MGRGYARVATDSDGRGADRATFPNLILTNFLEFRLYRNGEQVDAALPGGPVVLNRLRMARKDVETRIEDRVDLYSARMYTGEQ